MFGFAALCVAFYLAVQTFQFVVRRIAGVPAGAPLDEARAVLLLVSHFALVPLYAAVALRRFRHAPAAAVCGVLFGALFVLFELAYRSIEVFVPGPIARWDEIVEAWYFPLLGAHLLSTTAFTVACWPRAGDDGWQAVAAAAFGLNALRLVGRMLGGYAGVAPLAALSGPAYFPAMATVLALLLAWLVRQWRRAPA
jgi:hypothetical protein